MRKQVQKMSWFVIHCLQKGLRLSANCTTTVSNWTANCSQWTYSYPRVISRNSLWIWILGITDTSQSLTELEIKYGEEWAGVLSETKVIYWEALYCCTVNERHAFVMKTEECPIRNMEKITWDHNNTKIKCKWTREQTEVGDIIKTFIVKK